MKKIAASFLLIVALWLAAPLAYAQTRDGEFQISVGIGAAWNPPARFDLDIAGEYFFNDTFSGGLDFDILVNGRTFYNFIGFGRYNFEYKKFRRFSPYVGGGVGGLVSSNGRGWFDLMLPEAGLRWELTPHLLVGPNLSFHILAGSNTTWDLQTVGQLTYRF